MKKKNYVAKPGEMTKIVCKKVTEDGLKPRKIDKDRKNCKANAIKTGNFKGYELKYWMRGLEIFQALGTYSIEQITQRISQKEEMQESKAVEKIVMLNLAKVPIRSILDRIYTLMQQKYTLQRQIADIETIEEIVDKTRDGIITKQQTRIETDEQGNQKEVKYDIAMKEQEIQNVLLDYKKQVNSIEDRKFENYLNVGLHILEMIGTLNLYMEDKKNDKQVAAIGLTAIINVATTITRNKVRSSYPDQVLKKERTAYNILRDLAENEEVNKEEKAKKEQEAIQLIEQANTQRMKIEVKMGGLNAVRTVSSAVILGMVSLRELHNEKQVNPALLSKILLDMGKMNTIIQNFSGTIIDVMNLKDKEIDLQELEEMVENILEQKRIKVDPLKERQTSFKKIEITDFKGGFYERKDEENKVIGYEHTLQIPEFVAEQGQLVLLTGKSGTGKSTFIRLLKRGDIHNKQCLKIDDEEMVDKLGSQMISYKTDSKMGIHTNVLKEFTGKETITELMPEEKEQVLEILRQVKLEDNAILQELASKNYEQFSTGQRKRLSFAKAMYNTRKLPSILVVDEPADNVEKELIEEQFEMIRDYTKKNNIITIMVTHRIEEAKKYADKQYEIDTDGVMKEVQIPKKEIEIEEK
ncbi:MAG: ATP-binding cassette domain-containing protein [Clostridia bacterium]